MKLKEGDKVYCKNGTLLFFSKNEPYIIKRISDNGRLVIITYDHEKNWTWTFRTNPIYSSLYPFEDFFYTDKELRKIKLDEIKNR